jgi:hypothetical protein
VRVLDRTCRRDSDEVETDLAGDAVDELSLGERRHIGR